MKPPPALEIFPPERNWSAEWIGHPSSDRGGDRRHLLFRKTCEINGQASGNSDLLISARLRYRFWINGEPGGDGPPLAGENGIYYDRHPLTGLLKTGRNILAVLVFDHLWGKEDLSLLCELIQGERIILKTDTSWKVWNPCAWNPNALQVKMNTYAPLQEQVNGGMIPENWMESDFDDNDWESVRSLGLPPLGGPGNKTFERDIPLLEKTPVSPVEVVKVEECLGIVNRQRFDDLSLSLSQAGQPLEYAKVKAVECLCSGDGGCEIACSDRHITDPGFDGVYDPCLLLDFGKILTAYVDFEVSAPKGAVLEFGYAERLLNGHFNNAIESPFCDKYICREGRQTYRFLSWRAFRFLRIRLRDCPEGIRLHALKAVRERYPFMEKGKFESRDKTLNGVFDICRETIRLCSVDQLMDTPWREGAQWLGDVSATTLGGIYACFGDTALPAKFIRQSALASARSGLQCNLSHLGGYHIEMRNIPDYSLWWIMGVWRHYMYTGESAWIHTLYSEAQRIIRYHLQYLDEDGFLNQIPGWVFIDWAALDRNGSSAAYNAIFTGALDAVQKMADVIGDRTTSEWSSQIAENIRTRFSERFYSEENRVFMDARRGKELSETVSEQSNFAAILFDCCDSERAAEIISIFYEEEEDFECVESQPFFMVVVLEALRKQGRGDLSLKLIRDRWGKRMLAKGAKSCYEEWFINGSFREGRWKGVMRSQSHAWSACPAEYLLRQLSGIEILEPGCRKIRVSPQADGLNFTAVYPTPLGEVRVSHQNNILNVNLPDGINLVTDPVYDSKS